VSGNDWSEEVGQVNWSEEVGQVSHIGVQVETLRTRTTGTEFLRWRRLENPPQPRGALPRLRAECHAARDRAAVAFA
jgi:hypothetical protein